MTQFRQSLNLFDMTIIQTPAESRAGILLLTLGVPASLCWWRA